MMRVIREGLLLSKQVSPDEIAKLDLEGMSNEEFLTYLKSAHSNGQKNDSKIATAVAVTQTVSPSSGVGHHTVIPIGQLKSFLDNGCKYVDKYSDENGKPMAIVELGF